MERGNLESGIRNAEFATLFLLLFEGNHFAFTIFIYLFIYLFIYVFNQTKKGEKANVSLFTVRHVLVEFVAGMESIRNPECGIRNPFPCYLWKKSFRIYNIFLYLFF